MMQQNTYSYEVLGKKSSSIKGKKCVNRCAIGHLIICCVILSWPGAILYLKKPKPNKANKYKTQRKFRNNLF